MKVRTEITIDANRETVWREFDNADNMARWQPTLKSFTHKSGPKGEPGSVAELVYDENGREVRTQETITEKRKPAFTAGICDSDWSKALIVNHFEVIDDNTTRWVVYANHKFKGLMKFMAIFARKKILQRTEDVMQRFKLLVESTVADVSQ